MRGSDPLKVHHAQPNGTHSSTAAQEKSMTNGDTGSDEGGVGVEPIAIIGMGMRLPGGIRDANDFWNLLVNGRNGRCRVPTNRYAVDTWYGPGQALHVGTRYGNFLQDYNPAQVDTSFWSMSKEEVETMDPEQRLLLEVVYETFESSGWRDFRGEEVGVYVGTMGNDWDKIELQDSQNLDPVRADIYGDYVMANRVSYEFDLKGPSIVLRTACSSSLSALHMACQDIRSGECTAAVVCGTNLILTPRDTVIMTEQGVLSPSGSSQSFDADADGYGRGEAVNAILVKRLSDAVRDGDPVRAVIRNTCISGDGRTPGLTVPNPLSHEKLIRRAYRAAGIKDVSTVAMIECHGTGTAVGDPIEIEAIANVWGDKGIHIGSVKPNIGHGEGASGLSSVIKMVLALENSTIPPNINFKTPNPRIPWEEAKLVVPTKATPWPPDRSERVSINSFGIGGANAHVILESPTCANVAAQHCNNTPPANIPGRHFLLPFSATNQHSTSKQVENIGSYLSRNPEKLQDTAYTLATHREAHAFRAFSVTRHCTEGIDPPIITKSTGKNPSLIWVFTGQGAQWAQMGKELIENVPFASQRMDELQGYLNDLPEPPSWTLKEAMFAAKGESRLYEAEISQPCLAALQITLVDLLRSWGIQPAAVVGHSSGETGAGYAAGVINAKDAMTLAYHRGQITPPLKAAHRGGMAAVGMGKDQAKPYLEPGVIVGCENSPCSVSLSGDIDVLHRVMENIKKAHPEVLCRALQVECGYHSPHMFTIRDNFDNRVACVAHGNPPQVPFYSSVTGKLNTDFPRKYWSTNMVSPVLFSTAVEALLQDFPSAAFVELGPHSAMSGPLRQVLQKHSRTAEYIPTLVRNTNGHVSILKAAGQLWAQGFEIDLSKVNDTGKLLTDLPTYPWHYDAEYWVESRLSRDWRFRQFHHHELLGVRVLHTGDAMPAWRCKLRVEDVPWLRDHSFGGDIILPATAYLTMAGEAIRQLTKSKDYSVRNVTFLSPLMLGDEALEVITALVPLQEDHGKVSLWYDFSVSALHGETWTRLVGGQCRGGSASRFPHSDISTPLPRKLSPESFYYTCQRRGLTYGPKFRGLADITSHITQGKARAIVSDLIPASRRTSYYAIHPTTLDSSLHICMVAACRGLERNFTVASVPKSIDEMYVAEKRAGTVQVEGETSALLHGGSVADVTGVSNGKLVFHLRGLQVAPFGANKTVDDDPHAGAVIEWKADIDFVDPARLFRQDERVQRVHTLALACLLETRCQLSELQDHSRHLTSFKVWLDTIGMRAINEDYPGVLDCQELAAMKPGSRRLIINNLLDICEKEGEVVQDLARRIHWIYSHAKAFFDMNGVSNPPSPMEPVVDTRISEFLSNGVDLSQLFSLLLHQNAKARILLIESGTGELVGRVLTSLHSENRDDCHLVVSVPSQGAADRVRKRFANATGVVLNIVEKFQGFSQSLHDLVVIADDELNQGTGRVDYLRNIRNLLQPQGRLLIHQADPSCAVASYLRALDCDYWTSESPKSEKIREAFEGVLQKAGFDANHATFWSSASSSIVLARPGTVSSPRPRKVTVLCRDTTHPLISSLTGYLTKSQDIDPSFLTVGQDLPSGPPVLSLLDLESPFLHDITPDMFVSFKKSILSMQDATMLWVTGACQVGCQKPNYALTIGTLRTIRNEISADIVTLELDSFDSKGWEAVADILRVLPHRNLGNAATNPESEYAFSEGMIKTSRFHTVKVSEELLEQNASCGPKKLVVSKTGPKTSARWERAEKTELSGDSVEINVKATKFLGDGNAGTEGSGVISRIGSRVRSLQAGDKVVFFGSTTCSTHAVLSEKQCVKIPDTITIKDAAVLPSALIQAFYALEEVARIRKGESVLITNPCSAAGLAAIKLANMAMAEVFCTVVSTEETDYLEQYGVPRGKIVDVKATSLGQSPDKECFDIVLSVEGGKSPEEVWNHTAPFGKFINLSRNTNEASKDRQPTFHGDNRTCVSVNIEQLILHRPEVCQRQVMLLAKALELQLEGLIHLQPTIKAFDAADAENSLAYMQDGLTKAWEEVVLMMPGDTDTALRITPTRLQTRLRPDRTYIFVGGLGGLGQAITRFLVEKGARHLIFFSRSAEAAAQQHADYINELEHQGCAVTAVSGDVSSMDDVRRMLLVVDPARPVAGVLHAAMALQDVSLADMSHAQWQCCVLPKVRGAWNLHNALHLPTEPLDFFFLFSSISGLGGQVGQANYAAANAFLDAFAQYRRSLGLPCSVLDIGMMRGVGILARESYRLEAMRAESLHALHEQELLDALELMLARSYADDSPEPGGRSVGDGYVSRGQMAIGLRLGSTPTPSMSQAAWQRDPRTLFLQMGNAGRQDSTNAPDEGGAASLKEFLHKCNSDPSLLRTDKAATYLAREIAAALSAFRMREGEELDLDAPMETVGVDSLLSIELRNWFKQKVGVLLKIPEIRGADSVRGLGALTAKKISERLQSQ